MQGIRLLVLIKRVESTKEIINKGINTWNWKCEPAKIIAAKIPAITGWNLLKSDLKIIPLNTNSSTIGAIITITINPKTNNNGEDK